jgi:hypothetical protein
VTNDDAAADREILTWDGFGESTRDLARAVVADGSARGTVTEEDAGADSHGGASA